MIPKPLHSIVFTLIMILGLSVPSVAQTGEIWIADGFGLFLITVIAGILLAFAFQFLLTNLAVAVGITAIGDVRDKGRSSSSSSDSNNSDSSSSTPTGVKISSGFGLYLTITLAISLFFASLIAVKLSLIPDNTIGFTLGLIIWAGYLLLALYIDSKMISSLTGSIFSSVKDILGAGSSAVGSIFSSGKKSQMKDTARETVQAIHDEIRQEYDLSSIEKKLDEYINKLEPQRINMDNIHEQLAELIDDIEVKEEYNPEDPEAVKHLFLDVVSEQSNISQKDKKKLKNAFEQAKEIKQSSGSKADKAMSAVDKLAPGGEEQGKKYREKVEQYLRDTNEEELQPDKLKEDLEKILSHPQAAPDVIQARASKIDRSTLKSLLSKIDGMDDQKAEKYLSKAEEALNGIKSKVSEVKSSSSNQASDKKADAEQAIRQWFDRMNEPELRYNSLKHDVKRIMDDPKTTPSILKKRLQRMDRESMIALVSNNSKISREQAERVADKIEQGRDEVLNKVEEIENKLKEKTEQAKQEAMQQIEAARETAAAAAWWVFFAAIVSGGASVLGGILALSL
ncbi:MAG TPA: hypothetical protein VF181_07430 [Balneolaceae bacterium]